MSKPIIMRGVDLSHWNSLVDFSALKEECDFVILKIGGEEKEAGKLHIDKAFYKRFERAKQAGLHVGGYFFMSQKPEVFKCHPDYICGQIEKALDGMYFDMPLYIDVEGQPKGYRKELTAYVRDWCGYMESLNYYVGIYGSDVSTFQELVYLNELSSYDKWVARYGKEPKVVKEYGMWQCSSKGNVCGVYGKCDVNYAYKDYPTIIKKKGLNQ